VRNTKRLIAVSSLLLSICLSLPVRPALAAESGITPFRTSNQSPLIQIYGLPHDTGADIVPAGAFRIILDQDLSSNYTVHNTAREQITLDGETWRTTFAARYGIAPRWEMGVEIPYIWQGGGFLDSFIINWHKAFSLPQGGRDTAPKNRLNYSYRKDGSDRLLMNRAGSGIGDVSLTGGFSLYDVRSEVDHDRLALKAAVKFPVGDSSLLLGSGSTDFTLQFCGSMNNYTEWGTLGIFASLGGVAMTKGDVLRDQQNPLAGIGTFGIGWEPASWITFKVQLNGNTPLYRDSSLDEVSKSALLLIVGGGLRLPGDYLLDIGVAEDVAVATAPDVSFHLGLSKRF